MFDDITGIQHFYVHVPYRCVIILPICIFCLDVNHYMAHVGQDYCSTNKMDVIVTCFSFAL